MSYYFPIPNNFVCHDRKSYPLFLKGYAHFFYANLDESITDSDFDLWRINVYDIYGNLIDSNVGDLTKDIVGSPDYRFYSEINIGLGVSTISLCVFVIYNSSTGVVKYVSNPFRIIDDSSKQRYVLTEYRNTTNMFNFNYEDVLQYNSCFLEINEVDSMAEFDIENNNEETTGLTIPLKSQIKKVLILEANFFDKPAQDALSALCIHGDIKLNGNQVSIKSGFKKEQNRANALARGTFEVYDEQYSTINLNG